MIDSFNPTWRRHVAEAPIEEIMRQILSGCSGPEAFQPSLAQFAAVGHPAWPQTVLDFGAGLLRNTLGMLKFSARWRITAYDAPEMLGRGLAYYGKQLDPFLGDGRLIVAPDWASATRDRHDVTFASLCFQHIKEPNLRRYLAQLSSRTQRLVVFGRRVLDDMNTPVWPIVMDYFRLDLSASNPKEAALRGGDPHDHLLASFLPR